MKRAAFYIDGFNFYHPVSKRAYLQGKPHLKWMSYASLASLLINRGEEVANVKIFTARPTHLPDSLVRHRMMTRAWEAEGCQCILGRFKRKFVFCGDCRRETPHFEEKESDVNLAVHLVVDCLADEFDVAYVISSDGDVFPAFETCRRLCPGKELVTVSPPDLQPCKSIRDLSGVRLARVTWPQVESCPLPLYVYDSEGHLAATRPHEYNP